MGYSLAEAARDRGAYVTLISAPSNMEQPVGIHMENIENALEMKSAVDEKKSFLGPRANGSYRIEYITYKPAGHDLQTCWSG